jgi:hypothetical protein
MNGSMGYGGRWGWVVRKKSMKRERESERERERETKAAKAKREPDHNAIVVLTKAEKPASEGRPVLM